jgi:hypothetical protein
MRALNNFEKKNIRNSVYKKINERGQSATKTANSQNRRRWINNAQRQRDTNEQLQQLR